MILFFSLYCFFFVKSINFQVDKAFKQLMTEISTVAKEINSNALIKKHETITSNDLSLSLSSLSLVKPIVSLTSSVSSPIALSEASKSDESKNLDDLDDLELDNNINKFDDKEDKSLFITESNENDPFTPKNCYKSLCILQRSPWPFRDHLEENNKTL